MQALFKRWSAAEEGMLMMCFFWIITYWTYFFLCFWFQACKHSRSIILYALQTIIKGIGWDCQGGGWRCDESSFFFFHIYIFFHFKVIYHCLWMRNSCFPSTSINRIIQPTTAWGFGLVSELWYLEQSNCFHILSIAIHLYYSHC